MLRRFAYLIPVMALFLLPAISRAQFEAGNWELTLSAHGTANRDFKGTPETAASGNLGLGYFLTKELEVGVRQGIVWSDGGSSWSGDTRGAVDWHFDFDRLWPFIGINAGYIYHSSGSGASDHWAGGPEAGLKYFLNSTTFVEADISYEFDLQERISQGSWVYGVALGVKF